MFSPSHSGQNPGFLCHQYRRPWSVLLGNPTDLPYLRNRCCMLQPGWADWWELPEHAVLAPVSDFVQALIGCLDAPFLLMLAHWSLKLPEMFSVFVWCPLLSQSWCFHTAGQVKPFNLEFVGGRAQDLAAGMVNVNSTYWVSNQVSIPLPKWSHFILLKSWEGCA